MVEAGRFVDGLKAAGAGFFADVTVKFPCGCPFGIPNVGRLGLAARARAPLPHRV